MPNFSVIDDELDLSFATAAKPAFTSTPVLDSVPIPAHETESIDWDNATPRFEGDGLDRLRPKGPDPVRFAFVPGAPLRSDFTHYVGFNGKSERSYVCTGEDSCPACRSGNQKKRSYVALVVHYKNADSATGKLAAEVVPDYQIGYVFLSNANYGDILKAPAEGSRVIEVDWRMSYDGKRYNFTVAALKSRHSQRNESDKVKATAAPYLGRLPGKLGSPIPPNSTVNPPKQSGPSSWE